MDILDIVLDSLLAILGIFLLYFIYRIKPAATHKIEDGVYAVLTGFVNFYAIRTSAGVALFDSGGNPAMARRGLHKLGISPEEVTHVFLTHTDYDHAGGLKAFPGAKVYISKAEEKMINGEKARRGFLYNRKIPAYQTIEDGETIVVGETVIKLRLTPGHTAGSAIYRIGEDILATGDLLWYSRKGEPLPCIWLMNMDHKQEVRSAEAARDAVASAKLVLTGHTGVQRGKGV